MPIGVPKDRKPAPDEVLKLSSAPVHYRSHVPQIGAVVHLANYHVALCSCHGDSWRCCNDQTKEREDDDGNTTDLDQEECQ